MDRRQADRGWDRKLSALARKLRASTEK